MPKKSSKLAEQRRHGPVDQNLHDPRALGAGRGVYFRFQVKWMGCVEMKDSIRKFSLEDQTEIGRKAVQLAVQRKQEQRVAKLSKGATYNFGRVTSAGVDVALSVSSQGLLVTPLDYVGGDDDEVGIISFIPMRLVTLTVGGEDEVYDCITYIGKDAETQVREAFVFDCGEDVDYVLSTIAQAFFLAMAEAKEARIRAEQKPRRASASSPPKAISSTADDDTEAAEAPVLSSSVCVVVLCRMGYHFIMAGSVGALFGVTALLTIHTSGGCCHCCHMYRGHIFVQVLLSLLASGTSDNM
eukprot:m.53096 g.53096  ORF g.53096 m.53096 type:complete len:298 (-) comp15435_c0_seq6:1323-2216(-)